ncbi:MAG: hypothetical protein U1F66_02290 [bacterium]
MKKGLFLFLSIFAGSLLSFSVDAQVAQDQELTYKDLKFACTGVAESKEDPRWSKYSTKLMFTTGGRAYVSYIQLSVKDASGNLVFETDCDAPWILVDLKPGKYSVTATAVKKYTKNVSLTVGSGKQTELAIRFPEISGDM